MSFFISLFVSIFLCMWSVNVYVFLFHTKFQEFFWKFSMMLAIISKDFFLTQNRPDCTWKLEWLWSGGKWERMKPLQHYWEPIGLPFTRCPIFVLLLGSPRVFQRAHPQDQEPPPAYIAAWSRPVITHSTLENINFFLYALYSSIYAQSLYRRDEERKAKVAMGDEKSSIWNRYSISKTQRGISCCKPSIFQPLRRANVYCYICTWFEKK